MRKKKRWLEADIVDIGPGKELPLAKTLYVNRTPPKTYTAIDVSKLEMPEMYNKTKWKPTALMGETDVAELSNDRLPFIPNIVTCFEVIEHVEPAHARKILLLTKDAKLTHYLGRGQGTVDFTETMEIRKELQSKQ